MKVLKTNENIEHRIENRHTCSEEIFFATHSHLYEGELIDCGRNGLFIKTKEILPVGEILAVVDPYSSGRDEKRKGRIL
jgi:hypothetical protein